MKLLGIFLTIFMILSVSLSAFDIHNSFESKTSKCPTFSDCSSSDSNRASQNETGEHSHCLLHCVHFAATTLISKFVLIFIVFEDTLNTQYSFNLNPPTLEGPFRPPQV